MQEKGLTWNEHGLAAHHKYYLHGSELLHSHLAAVMDGMAQFGAEDDTEEDDAASGEDVGERGVSGDYHELLIRLPLHVDDVPLAVDYHKCESKAADDQCHQDTNHGYDVPPECLECAAHHANLEHHGKLHGDDGEEAEDLGRDGDAFCAGDFRVVVDDIVVVFEERAQNRQAHEDGADEDESQSSLIEDEDDAPTLLGLGEESQNQHQDDGHADLDAEDDCGLDSCTLERNDLVKCCGELVDSIGVCEHHGLCLDVE